MGPWTYAKHLTSGARLPFTAAYFGSIALTLYFAIGVSKSIYYVVYFFCHFKQGCFIVHFCAFAHFALSRSTPTIPPYLMILSLHFLVCRTLLYPHTESMVALHNREKGNLAAFAFIAQYNLSLRLVGPAVGQSHFSSLNSSHSVLGRLLCSLCSGCITSHHSAGLGCALPYFTLSDAGPCHRARSPEPSRSIYVSPSLTARSSCFTCISQLHTPLLLLLPR